MFSKRNIAIAVVALIFVVLWWRNSGKTKAATTETPEMPVPDPDQDQPIVAKKYTPVKVQRADTAHSFSPGNVNVSFTGGENVEHVLLRGMSGTTVLSSTMVLPPFNKVSMPIPVDVTAFVVVAISYFADNMGSSETKITVYPTVNKIPVNNSNLGKGDLQLIEKLN